MAKEKSEHDKDTYVRPLPNGKFGIVYEGLPLAEEYDTRQEAQSAIKDKVLLQG